MTRLARLVAGRRSKWVVLGIWVLIAAGTAGFGSKVEDITDDRTESFLPDDAESTQVVRLQSDRFPGGETSTGLIVYQRDGGLTAADRRKVAADARGAQEAVPELVAPPVVPFAKPPRGAPKPDNVSPDGSLAFTTLAVPADPDKLAKWGKELRKITGDGGGGLDVYVTGDLGFNSDFEEVFGDLDAKLLIVTVILVLVLLGAIYRAPIAAITPLLVVFFAYGLSQALIYAYGEAGNTVSSNATSILIVLMFGVGTDYCLLLMSRYREELRAHEDRHEAIQVAVSRAGPAIIASGLTVALAMLVLVVAESGSIKSLGPVSAIGITCVFLAGVTLLPALLAIFGRVTFWPRRREVSYDPQHQYVQARGVWRRVGATVLRRPGVALGATGLLLAVGALGLFAYKVDFSIGNAFKTETESVRGFKALQQEFPAGTLSPTTIIVQRAGGAATPADVQAARQRVEGAPGVAGVTPPTGQSEDKRLTSFGVVLDKDPFTVAATERIPQLRERLDGLPAGVSALVGGGSAVNYDYGEATNRDIKIIVPLALLVVAIILGVLLSAILAPIVLILTVVASFFGTLGLAMLFIRYVVGDPGVDNSLPTFAFIFLVALGTDYTIFLMSRVREEARRHGTREGTLRALAATGAVITSAGIILAGTFSVLMTMPVTFAFNIGFIVALGILLDTFVVRTIMVPAAVELIGDKIWWPSTERGGGRVLREHIDPEPEPARG